MKNAVPVVSSQIINSVVSKSFFWHHLKIICG